MSEQAAGLSLPLREVTLLPSRGTGKEQEVLILFPLGVEGNSFIASLRVGLQFPCQAGTRACHPDPPLPPLLQLEHCWPAWKWATQAQAAALGTAPWPE